MSRFAKSPGISNRDTFASVLMPPYCLFRVFLPWECAFGGIYATVDVSRFGKSAEKWNRDTFERARWSFVAVCGGPGREGTDLLDVWWSIVVVSHIPFHAPPVCSRAFSYVPCVAAVEFRSSFLGYFIRNSSFVALERFLNSNFVAQLRYNFRYRKRYV